MRLTHSCLIVGWMVFSLTAIQSCVSSPPTTRKSIDLGALPTSAGADTYATETREPRTKLEKRLIVAYEKQGRKVTLNLALERAACYEAIFYHHTLTIPWNTLHQRVLWRGGYAGNFLGGYYLKGARSQLAEATETPEIDKNTPGVLDIGLCRYGKGKQQSQVLLVGSRNVTFKTLPKFVKPGEDVLVEGRFEVPVHLPQQYATQEGPQVASSPLTLTSDGSFSYTWKAPVTPGVYTFEIVGLPPEVQEKDADLNWRKGYAAGSLYVGVEEGKLFRPGERPPSTNLPQNQWHAFIQERLNDMRHEEGLPPFSGDIVGMEIAQERVEEVARNSDLGPDPVLVNKFARHGLAIGRYYQHQSRFEFLSQWLDLQKDMPTFREMVFNPRFDRIAFGFSIGQKQYALIGYFFEERSTIKEKDIRALRDTISQEAEKTGQAAFRSNKTIDSLLKQAVGEICQSGPIGIKDIHSRVLGSLEKKAKKMGFASWYGDFIVTNKSIDELGFDLPDERYTHLSVSVCRGNFGPDYSLADLVYLFYYRFHKI